jgi:hypothetical protein
MPAQQKAWLCEIAGEDNTRTGRNVQLQFNPETLRITHGAQVRPPVNPSKADATTPPRGQGDVPGSTPFQHTGAGSTRLSVQVWFDVTSVMLQGDEGVSDVRDLTEKVAYFIRPKGPPNQNGTPQSSPRVQFAWGTIIFSGVMDSLDESLELFSTDGVPLRASMNIGISEGRIQIGPGARGAGGGVGGGSSAGLNLSAGIGIGASASLGVGTQPLVQAEAGISLQAMASANFGANADWQAIATANGIENPRQLQPGQLINMNARASASVSASASASASFSLTGE